MSEGMGGHAADRLRSFIERIERLEEEKATIASDIKDVYAEAKSSGFDTRTIREIVKIRKMSEADRREQEALLDLYKAALGMLDGTPLGDAAIRRLTKKPEPREEPAANQQGDIEEALKPEASKPDPEPEPEPDPGPTIEEARTQGREAAQAGKPVTDNPFPPRDPRRAAWDEAWCQALGSDGMDLPQALRRNTPKKKPGKDSNADDKKAA